MSKSEKFIHPYIPNSVPEIREEMLKEIGVNSVEELLTTIPKKLRFAKSLNLPKYSLTEDKLRRHIEKIFSKNKTCKDYLNFLGAGCWQHIVPVVVDEIISRAEFLTAYASNTYSDLGKWQAFFEFQSMMGELLEMDVVSPPIFDWGSAASFAIRMASRLTGRKEVLISKTIGPERFLTIKTFCKGLVSSIEIKMLDYDPDNGLIDLYDLKRKISTKTAAVYFENPSYLGLIESQGEEISKITHNSGAECIVGVDPISLGLLKPPVEYGADVACGEIQSLGIHMNYGGGVGGFIASNDDAKYVTEYPLHLVSITETKRKGEFGFGYCTFDRTLYMAREKGKDFTGTFVGLWTIAAAVYLALMGPKGIMEIGDVIIKKSHYAAKLLSEIKGIRVPFSPHFFKEFVVNFDETNKSVHQVNKMLLDHGIFGGKDISSEFSDLGKSALYCVTEVHSNEEILELVNVLEGVIK